MNVHFRKQPSPEERAFMAYFLASWLMEVWD